MGDEFQANTYTTSAQLGPAIASDGLGGFVAVWSSYVQDGSDFGVFGQRFGPTGAKAGPEFRVNSYTTGHQAIPAVAAASGHGFLVVWESDEQDGATYGIFGQRYDDSGAPLGAEFPVNAHTTSAQRTPSVAMGGSGEFVVVWSGSGAGDGYGIQGQRFDASGAKVGPEFPVNTYTTGAQSQPAIAARADGGFVVVWTSGGQDGSGNGVRGRRLDGTAAPLGPEFAVNTYTTGDQYAPAIAMDRGGDFVVVWSSEGEDGSASGSFGQRFNRAGERAGPEFQVNAYTTADQLAPAVAFERSGGFVALWTSMGQDGDEGGVFGQRFARDGARVGSEFRTSVAFVSSQFFPAVADTGRGLAAVWTGELQDGSGEGIFGRRQEYVPARLAVDADDVGSSDANGILESGETVVVAPAWENEDTGFNFLGGTAASFSGPAGGSYTIADAAALYGIPGGSAAACNDCYRVQVSGTRPATHWDATLRENLSSGGAQLWTLHVGDSFADVSHFQPFYGKIETLLHNGITSGCTATKYCPSDAVARDQMAIFVAKGIAGSGEYVPSAGSVLGSPYDCAPGGTSLFDDVAPADSFCKHVHFLAAQNVTLGCGPTTYCPSQTITRDAMASFIAKAIVAPGGGGAVPETYGPDPVTGFSYSCAAGSPNVHFADVPVSNAFCKHVHFLWAKGIVAGCSATQYCPTQPVHRDAMSKFLVNGFGLALYGP